MLTEWWMVFRYMFKEPLKFVIQIFKDISQIVISMFSKKILLWFIIIWYSKWNNCEQKNYFSHSFFKILAKLSITICAVCFFSTLNIGFLYFLFSFLSSEDLIHVVQHLGLRMKGHDLGQREKQYVSCSYTFIKFHDHLTNLRQYKN